MVAACHGVGYDEQTAHLKELSRLWKLAGNEKQAGKFRGERFKRIIRRGEGLDGFFLRLRLKAPRMWQEGQKIIKRLPFLPSPNCQAAKPPPPIARCPGQPARFTNAIKFKPSPSEPA
jgi:hypothetical protein